MLVHDLRNGKIEKIFIRALVLDGQRERISRVRTHLANKNDKICIIEKNSLSLQANCDD